MSDHKKAEHNTNIGQYPHVYKETNNESFDERNPLLQLSSPSKTDEGKRGDKDSMIDRSLYALQSTYDYIIIQTGTKNMSILLILLSVLSFCFIIVLAVNSFGSRNDGSRSDGKTPFSTDDVIAQANAPYNSGVFYIHSNLFIYLIICVAFICVVFPFMYLVLALNL